MEQDLLTLPEHLRSPPFCSFLCFVFCTIICLFVFLFLAMVLSVYFLSMNLTLPLVSFTPLFGFFSNSIFRHIILSNQRMKTKSMLVNQLRDLQIGMEIFRSGVMQLNHSKSLPCVYKKFEKQRFP